MTDLGMKIDIQAKGAQQAASDIDRVSRSAENLEKKAKSLGYFFDQQGRLRASNGQYAKSNDEVANSLRKMKTELDASSGGALRLNKSLSEVNNTTQGTSEVMGLARRAIIGLIGTQAISQATQMADVMTNLTSQVRFVTGSYEEAARIQAKLLTISNETYASLEATSTLYTRTARAMEKYGKSQQDILTFTEAINNAMRVGGVGATEQASALLQLSQALGSGVLQGDEFRSIAEAAPILLDVLAKNTGVAREELKKLGSEGKLTSEILFNAISASSEELKRQASTMETTGAGSLTILKNNMLQLSDEVLNQSGIMSTVSSSIMFIANNLEVVLVPALGVATIATARLTSSVVTSAASFGQGSIEAIKYQMALARATGASNAMSISMVAGSQAVRLLSGAMALLGGPVGVATLAAGGIAAYALSTKDAKKSTQELENELLQLEQRFKNLDKNGRDAAFVQLDRNLRDTKKQYEELKTVIGRAETDLAKLKFKNKSQADIREATEDIALMKGELSLLGRIMEQTTGTMERLSSPIEEAEKPMNNLTISGNEVADTLAKIEERYKQIGKTSIQVSMMKLAEMGATRAELYKALHMLTAIDKDEKGKKKSRKKDGVSYFGDRLKSITDEIAKLRAANESLEQFGEEGRYTSVQEITAELMNQDSVLKGISETQKNMLLEQAQQLDNQRQLNEVLKLRSDYQQDLSDMEFELELIGRTAEEIENLRFERELEKHIKTISNGASKETIALLEEEIRKIRERKAAYNSNKNATDNDPLGGISDGFTKYVNSMGTVREQFATATEATFSGLTDAISSFAVGADQSFSEMTRSVLQNIAKMLVQMAIINSMKLAFGFADGGSTNSGASSGHWSSLFSKGFSVGGYTGVGGKYQPAGLVHRDEYVINKEATGNIGVGVLDQLHAWAKNGAQGVFQVGSDPTNPYSINSGAIQAANNMTSSTSFVPYSISPIQSPTTKPNIVLKDQGANKSLPLRLASGDGQNSIGDINLKVIIHRDDSIETEGDIGGQSIAKKIKTIVDNQIKEHKFRSGGLLNK